MKKHLASLLIIVPLLFIAGGAFAAYTFVGPTAAPTSNNTDGPLDISATDQVKAGGLAVNTFQSRTASDFAQQSSFAGLVRGGTSTLTNSSIAFGSSANPTAISNVGNAAITGVIQSDTLKTGGGDKPLCADATGKFYICGATTTTPTSPRSIYIFTGLQTSGNGVYGAYAAITEPTNVPITVTIDTTGTQTRVSFLRNLLTANADDLHGGNNCPYGSSPTQLTPVTIPPDQTMSNVVNLTQGCTDSNTTLSVGSYYPHTDNSGRAIVVQPQ